MATGHCSPLEPRRANVKRRMVLSLAVGLTVAAASPGAAPSAQQQDTPAAISSDLILLPTNHPRVPADLSRLWLTPEKVSAERTSALTEFTQAVKFEVDGNFAKALPILSRPAVQQGALGHYAQYYKGLAELRLGRPSDARITFRALAERAPVGFIAEA